PATVLARAEKRGLLEYLGAQAGVDVLVIPPTREWPETLLRSQDRWAEHNLVLLPDTEFEPGRTEETVVWNLSRGFSLVFATFEVSDPKTWGMVITGAEQTLIAEKPATKRDGFQAWGMIGFQKNAGHQLFTSLLESCFDHDWKSLPFNSKTVELTSFRDLTRS
ncbi:MAG: hypothetical protein ABL958_20520, partial [Bdellovibrionia bacterium]